jgi:hypothetical protein
MLRGGMQWIPPPSFRRLSRKLNRCILPGCDNVVIPASFRYTRGAYLKVKGFIGSRMDLRSAGVKEKR